MNYDYDAIFSEDISEGYTESTDPIKLFTQYDYRNNSELRREQIEVLEHWCKNREAKDNIIVQNAGSGKTLVGLLICQVSLNEGNGPAVYAAPSVYLVKQVREEALLLGIDITEDPKDPEFAAGKKTLICTIDKIINGYSVFGLRNDAVRIEIGTLIVDDAHLAAARVRSKFGMTFEAGDEIYKFLTSTFREELKRQGMSSFNSGSVETKYNTISIPFWTWSEKYQQIEEYLNPKLSRLKSKLVDDSYHSARFSWPFLKRNFGLTELSINSERAQVQLRVPLLDEIPAYVDAKRRVFLTATVPDPSSMIFNLGVNKSALSNPIRPTEVSGMGRRLVLAPRKFSGGLSDEQFRRTVFDFSRGMRPNAEPDLIPPKYNVVVLCPSGYRASAWKDLADEIVDSENLDATVMKLKSGTPLGLVVMANKYDGIDLPDGACRLLVFDHLSAPIDTSQQREAAALQGSNAARFRTVQRLEQGMGRGVRSAEDYCVIMLWGLTPETAVSDPKHLAYFPDTTRKQIEFGTALAKHAMTDGLTGLERLLEDFLYGSEDLVRNYHKYVENASYHLPESMTQEIDFLFDRKMAWTRFRINDFQNAIYYMKDAINSLTGFEKGWYLEELAFMTWYLNREQSWQLVRDARELNREVVLPPNYQPQMKKQGESSQLKLLKTELDRFSSSDHLFVEYNNIASGLTFNQAPEAVESSEESLFRLGKMLGFDSSRPEAEIKVGPDVLWKINAKKVVVIELKTGTTRNDPRNSKREAGQLSTSVNWATKEFPGMTVVPVLVSRFAETMPDAVFPDKTRVMTEKICSEICQRFRDMYDQLISREDWHDERWIDTCISSFNFSGANILSSLKFIK